MTGAAAQTMPKPGGNGDRLPELLAQIESDESRLLNSTEYLAAQQLQDEGRDAEAVLSRLLAEAAKDSDLDQDLCRKAVRYLYNALPAMADIVDAGAFMDADLPPPVPAIGDLVDLCGKLALYGPSKARKSFLLMQLCLCWAIGRKSFLRWIIPQPLRVLLVQMEIPANHFQKRLRRMAEHLTIVPADLAQRLYVWNCRGATPDLYNDDGLRMLTDTARRLKAQVIAFDPVYKVFTGKENDDEAVREFLSKLDTIATDTGALVVYVHHFAKGISGDKQTQDRYSGSGVWARDFDAAIYLTPHKDEEDAAVVETVQRCYPPTEPFTIEWQDGHFAESDLAPVVLTSSNRRQNNEPIFTPEELTTHADCPKTEYVERLRKLGFTARGARAKCDALIGSGALHERKRPGTTMKWIAEPATMTARVKEWENPELIPA